MTTSETQGHSKALPVSGIRDNHHRGSVGSFLQGKIQPGSRLSIVSAYFTIHAFEALKNQLTAVEDLQFLFGEPRFARSLDPDKVDSNRDRRDLKAWFDELWQDESLVEDVRDQVLQYLEQLYQNHAPQFIYYKTLFHIFERFLADQDASGLLAEKSQLVDTVIWNALFEFQKDGVKGAINKIRAHTGDSSRNRTTFDKTEFNRILTNFSPLSKKRAQMASMPQDIESNRKLLADAPLGLYGLVPTHPDYPTIALGVIFCLRQKTAAHPETVNPLQPYFLVYVRDDRIVRYSFAQPKQILEVYRLLCADRTTPYEELCNLFDQETRNGTDMLLYNERIETAISSIAHTFKRRSLSQLQTSRGAVLVNQQQQATETSEFDLITWLVIKSQGED